MEESFEDYCHLEDLKRIERRNKFIQGVIGALILAGSLFLAYHFYNKPINPLENSNFNYHLDKPGLLEKLSQERTLSMRQEYLL